MTMNDLFRIADRIYTLIRAFWVREYKAAWNSSMDTVPARWFKDPLTKGNFKGAKLNKEKYEEMLKMYYKKRGWDNRGIPTKKTLTELELSDVAKTLSQYIKLTP